MIFWIGPPLLSLWHAEKVKQMEKKKFSLCEKCESYKIVVNKVKDKPLVSIDCYNCGHKKEIKIETKKHGDKCDHCDSENTYSKHHPCCGCEINEISGHPNNLSIDGDAN